MTSAHKSDRYPQEDLTYLRAKISNFFLSIFIIKGNRYRKSHEVNTRLSEGFEVKHPRKHHQVKKECS